MSDRFDDQRPPPGSELYRLLQRLRALAISIVSGQGFAHIADEIVDEAIGIALEKPPEWWPSADAAEGRFKAWFLGIVHNCKLNAARKGRCRRGKQVLLRATMQTAERPEPVELLDVRRAIARLPSKAQRLIKRLFYEGLSLDEVASEDGCHSRTVRRRLAAILKLLRAALTE